MTLIEDDVEVDDTEDTGAAKDPAVLLAYCCSPLSNSDRSALPAAEGSVPFDGPVVGERPLTTLELEVELVLDVELAEALPASWDPPPP